MKSFLQEMCKTKFHTTKIKGLVTIAREGGTPSHLIKSYGFNTFINFFFLLLGHNMYHHMTNFLNLYLTQHMLGNFSTDIKIIIWDAVRFFQISS